MKKVVRILVTVGLLTALLLSFGMAAGEGVNPNPDVKPPEIPVTVSTKGTFPETPETYSIRLTPVDGNTLRPIGSTGEDYVLKITGPTEAEPVSGRFPTFHFTRPGIYYYTISMDAGSYPGATYDGTVYVIKITVYNGDEGGFAYATAIRKRTQEDVKLEDGEKIPVSFTVIYPAEKTERTVAKVWDDNKNQDGIRPESVTVHLLADGADTGKSATLNEGNNWEAAITGLDRYKTDTRDEIVYTWSEDGVEGYTPRYDPADGSAALTTVTNTLTNPETTASTVIKDWDDDQDRDGVRPKGGTAVRVYLLADGSPVQEEGHDLYRDLTVGEGWTATVRNLPKNKAGKTIEYTWVEREQDVPAYYLNVSASTADGVTTITNRHVTDVTTRTFVKVWDDDNNRDGIRPETLRVRLLADGQPARDRDGNVIGEDGYVILSGASSPAWQATVENLPVNDGGKPIEYTWEEEGAEGYTEDRARRTETVNTVTVTNRHVPETKDITVRKVWDDQDNQDGLRTEVTLRLIGTVPSTGARDSTEPHAVIGPEGETEATFTVPVRYQGEEIVYTVEEDRVPAEYTAEYAASEDGTVLTVTNSHTPHTVRIRVTKIWDDADNQDGLRAATTILLTGTAGGETIVSEAFDIPADAEGDALSKDFEDLPEKHQGAAIQYSVSEAQVPGYEAPICRGSVADGFTVTNRHEPEKITVSGEKVWNDAENQDGKRPGSVIVRLMKGKGETRTEVRSAAVTADSGWTFRFENLDKYENGGTEIRYTLTEDAVAGYTTAMTGSAEDGFTVTNTYTPETVNLSVRKEWNDHNNQDGKRPERLTVTLLANGMRVRDESGNDVTAELNAGNGWSASFRGMPKYRAGVELTYGWMEPATEGYTREEDDVTVIGDSYAYVLTNTHQIEKTSAMVSKKWNDGNNQDGIRPAALTVRLLANGEDTGRTVTLTGANGWTNSIDNLDKYADGAEIRFTWEEGAVEGYERTGEETEGTITTLTNTHIPETVTVSVTKVWSDDNNRDGLRPESLTVSLRADGAAAVDAGGSPVTAELNAGNGWTASVAGLPKYRAGQVGVEAAYSWTEPALEGYTSETARSVNGNHVAYILTNAHETELTTATVVKVWDDNDNQDGVRPESVTVRLLADGEDTGVTMTLSEGNFWSGTDSGLNKFASGAEIRYTWQEAAVPGYTQAAETDGRVTTLTNTHEIEETEVSVTKVWDDSDDQDGIRPERLIVTLLADGAPARDASGSVITAVLNAANGWSAAIGNLAKYRAGDVGAEVSYSWSEPAVAGYTAGAAAAGETPGATVLTNTHEPEKTDVTVRKVWDDNDNQDGIRPAGLAVRLYANGEDTGLTVTLNGENGWTGTIGGLDRFAGGAEITYTWVEEPAEGYTLTGEARDADTTALTNTHTPETVTVEGGKIWDDAENRDGIRPERVMILLMDGENVAATATVSAETGWLYSFTDLPKYRGGTEIEYTVAEAQVAGYSAAYEATAAGFNVINTHIPEETAVTVTKVWNDADNQEGLRPAGVTVRLMADGRPAAGADGQPLTAILNAENGWTRTFGNLPVNNAGAKIRYTVEEDPTAGYETAITGTAEGGYAVTNTHTVETVDLMINKVWVDDGDRDGLRPGTITVNLLQNGAPYRTLVLSSQMATAADAGLWTYTVTGLPRFTGGTENVYTVTEAPVAGYTATITGFTITNTHEPALTSRTIVKAWAGEAGTGNTRPDSVVMTLTANGAPAVNDAGQVITRTLSAANNWRATVDGLPAYADGSPITYRWTEAAVPRYQLSNFLLVPTADGENITLTNSFIPIYNLTVLYRYLDTGETAAPTHTEELAEGDPYSVTSPTIPGYVTKRIRVFGRMPARDVIEIVYYYPADIIIDDFETPLGLGQVFINVGDCLE